MGRTERVPPTPVECLDRRRVGPITGLKDPPHDDLSIQFCLLGLVFKSKRQ